MRRCARRCLGHPPSPARHSLGWPKPAPPCRASLPRPAGQRERGTGTERARHGRHSPQPLQAVAQPHPRRQTSRRRRFPRTPGLLPGALPRRQALGGREFALQPAQRPPHPLGVAPRPARRRWFRFAGSSSRLWPDRPANRLAEGSQVAGRQRFSPRLAVRRQAPVRRASARAQAASPAPAGAQQAMRSRPPAWTARSTIARSPPVRLGVAPVARGAAPTRLPQCAEVARWREPLLPAPALKPSRAAPPDCEPSVPRPADRQARPGRSAPRYGRAAAGRLPAAARRAFPGRG